MAALHDARANVTRRASPTLSALLLAGIPVSHRAVVRVVIFVEVHTLDDELPCYADLDGREIMIIVLMRVASRAN